MAANTIFLPAWVRPGRHDPDRSANAVVRQLAAQARRSAERIAGSGTRPVLTMRWTLDGAGRLVAHWDADPPD